MSDNFLRLIPTQPGYVPDNKVQEAAKQCLSSLFSNSSEVRIRVVEEIEFIDAGANFKKVSCPACGKEVSMDWWSAAMDEAYKSRFHNMDVLMPCCGTKTTLNNLNYNFPQGFARFIIEVTNPCVSELDKETVGKIEEIAGCKLRLIWTHY